jgi:hypothetical protein
MGSLSYLAGQAAEALRAPLSGAGARLVEGIIVSQPADTTEGVLVRVETFDRTLRYGPCPWAARVVDDSTYAIPSDGDRCLLAVTEENDAWVIQWWPYD